MGHRSTIIFASILMMATACSQDFDADQIATTVNVDDAEPGYAVPVEQALLYLDNELDMIYGDQTRAEMPRRTVKAVRNVAYRQVAQTTRAAEMPDDVADLFYIVEFADGEGSAVLGADARVEPVLAILDQTVLTPEDFEKADIESNDITSYMTAMIAKSATNQLASFPGITIDTTRLPIDKFWGPGRDTVYCKQAPLLKTKWHQNSPYNNACSADINQYGILQHCKAGCVAIATAQILKHNINGRYITISGDTFDKFLLDGCNYGSNQSYAAQSEAARFVYKIGVYLNTDYGLDSSIAYTKDTPPLFQHTGYQSVSLRSFTLTNARDMICNKQYVFYMSGIQEGSSAGHAWVIDGWNEYTVRYWNCYYDTHGGTDMEILDRVLLESRTYTKVHCNFGWGGMCDGYYSGDMFDTTKWLDRDDIDTSVGDYAGSAGQMFNSNLQMITYSLQ